MAPFNVSYLGLSWDGLGLVGFGETGGLSVSTTAINRVYDVHRRSIDLATNADTYTHLYCDPAPTGRPVSSPLSRCLTIQDRQRCVSFFTRCNSPPWVATMCPYTDPSSSKTMMEKSPKRPSGSFSYFRRMGLLVADNFGETPSTNHRDKKPEASFPGMFFCFSDRMTRQGPNPGYE